MAKLTEKHNYEGTLVCVEGIDGSGKSTQLALLRDWLKASGKDVIYTEWNSSPLISQTTKLAKKKTCCRRGLSVFCMRLILQTGSNRLLHLL